MELQITKTTLPRIISNYQEMKVYLVEHLKQYEIEVTQANLPQAKKMATELNSLAKQIDDKRKEILSSVEEPIDVFKNQIGVLDYLYYDDDADLIYVTKFDDNGTPILIESFLSDIKWWSKNKKEAKIYLNTKKYNL